MALVDQQFTDGGVRENLLLASNVSAAGAQSPTTAYGGDYVFSVNGSGTFSVQLQSLGPDGTSWQNIGAAKTASDETGGSGVGIGSNARVRVNISGASPTSIYASLSRLP